MRKKIIALGITSLLMSQSANAALVTSLQNVDVNGALYDVEFVFSSFNNMWDSNDDGVFDNGTPTFWLDQSGAGDAWNAVSMLLGYEDTTSVEGYDNFFIPVGVNGQPSINPGGDSLFGYSDFNITTFVDDPILGGIPFDNDATSTHPYAVFTLVSVAPVPVPAAVWLFGSGLLGLIGVARRKIT